MRRRHRTYRGATDAEKSPTDPTSISSSVSNLVDVSSSSPSVSGSHVSSAGGSTFYGNVNVRLDINASALSVDATGSVAVLAGRKGLHLVDLEAPFLSPATLHHQAKLEVTVVKCNPHTLFKSHVASSSNRNALIWDIADVGVGFGASASIGNAPGAANGGGSGRSRAHTSSQPVVATLRAHTRPISDVAWSPMEPSLLATCSADAKTLLWDMRTPQRPVQTLNAFNLSVLQVEWNRVDGTSLATAHDGEVRVWDLRAAAERTVAPVALITAHMQKIYGLDWHPDRMNELLTCSEDKTVKFWNIKQPRVCQGTLTTGAPVWRAQYTPFGDGLVTISHRMDNTIRLWALSHGDTEPRGHVENADVDVPSATAAGDVTADLVSSFVGHTDVVKGLAWRLRPQTSGYQLVSWSKDQELHLWQVDQLQLEACGYDSASYLAETAPFEGNTTASARQLLDARRFIRAERTDTYALHSSYSISALKADFVPLVIPKAAVPLGTEEYTFQGNESTLQAFLALEDELMKGNDEPAAQQANHIDKENKRTKGMDETHALESTSAASAGTARALPCPRISGAAFSGPNRLLVFDSRVAIGQSRSSTVPPAVAAGKENKPQPVTMTLPRTYEELLDLRDSRFATKKKNKPPVPLVASSSSRMDNGAKEWTGAAPQEFMDNSTVDDRTRSLRGYLHPSSMYYASGNGAAKEDVMFGNGNELELEPSDYLTTYFSSTESAPLQTMPSSAVAGLQLSPRFPAARSSASRVEQATPALNLDLSISVTILDLSQLCGISSILTYKTELLPRRRTQTKKQKQKQKKKNQSLGASVNRSMLSWMLRAAENFPHKRHPTHLTRVLQRLVVESETEDEETTAVHDFSAAVAATCARNAHTALLAGRRDLQQLWSLLEISAAPKVELPLYKKPTTSSMPQCLCTSHPWGAHPLGKRLVQKVLAMYEQVGDVQALASIVCALKPSERPPSDERRDVVPVSSMAMDEQLPVLREERRSSVEELNAGKSANLVGGVRTRWSTSHTLPHLGANLTEASDAPPLMRGTRRSSSHTETRSQGALLDKDVAFRAPKDWPIASSGTSSAASSRQSSPVRERTLSTSSGLNPSSRDVAYKASAPSLGSGWKMDVDTPFKTWSGNSTKDAPPPRLTAETFQSPIQAVNGRSPASSLIVSASPRIGPLLPSPLSAPACTIHRDDEVDPRDRVLLQLSSRSSADDKCLLSSHPEDEARYDMYKEAYADVLYRYGAMNLRNEVLKTKSHGIPESRGISMGLICGACNAKTIDLVCTSCRDFALRCSVCQLVVRGQSMFCIACGHGGHAAHVREWFELESACPTGCGCWCKQATATMPASQQDQQESDHTIPPSRSHSF